MNVLISAGPTREYLDSVRFISNPSTGKMGFALARAAAARGHDVTLVAGPVELKPPDGVELVRVVSAAEMASACKRVFRSSDVAFMTAAVCDYRPRNAMKLKRAKQDEPMTLLLDPTEDIAAALGRRKAGRILIGFAMEDHDPHAHAERKQQKKNFDLIVLNGPENVGSNRAKVEFFSPTDGWSKPFEASKLVVARRLVERAEEMCARRRPR